MRIEERIYENFSKLPNEPMLCWQNTWWSRAAFMELVEECERLLKESNFREGQKLGLLLPNSPIMLALVIAVWKLHGTVVPIDPKSGFVPATTKLLHADVFAVITYKGCASLTSLIEEEGIPCYVAANLDQPGGVISGRDTEPEDPETAVIFYTSGTTGTPKAVPLTHSNILAFFEAAQGDLTDVDDEDVFLNALPNFNSFGLIATALLPMLLGARVLVIQSFFPVKNTIEAMRKAGVTMLIVVPIMLSLIFRAAKAGAILPRTVRHIISGGDRLPEKFQQKSLKWFGIEIAQGYGLTESSSVVSLQSASERMGNSVGKLISCVQGEIRDSEGNVLPEGNEGTLWIKGDNLTAGYYRNPELTAERFHNGWFDTGDIATIDKEGYLTIVGRTSEVIFVGGCKVYATEVEKKILEFPGVAEVAVVGIPRPLSGEIIKACIVLKESSKDISSREISDFCKKELSYFKVPRIIEFMDELPRSPIGDVLKRNLIDDHR